MPETPRLVERGSLAVRVCDEFDREPRLRVDDRIHPLMRVATPYLIPPAYWRVRLVSKGPVHSCIVDGRTMLCIFVTGGTFDKTYDELSGRLVFSDKHLPERLRPSRSRVEGSIR